MRLVLPLAKVRLDGVLPVRIQGGAAPDGGYSLAHHLVVEAGALAVAVVVHCPVGGDAQMARRLHCVDVGPQEEKFPAILFFLPPDHLLDLLGRIAAAGVLHAVGGDDKEGVLGHILVPGVLVDVPNVVDGPADGVQQGGAAPDIVLLVGDGLDLAHLHPVVEHLTLVVKEDGGDERLAGLLLLLFDHGVEAADGVPLHPPA